MVSKEEPSAATPSERELFTVIEVEWPGSFGDEPSVVDKLSTEPEIGDITLASSLHEEFNTVAGPVC